MLALERLLGIAISLFLIVTVASYVIFTRSNAQLVQLSVQKTNAPQTVKDWVAKDKAYSIANNFSYGCSPTTYTIEVAGSYFSGNSWRTVPNKMQIDAECRSYWLKIPEGSGQRFNTGLHKP